VDVSAKTILDVLVPAWVASEVLVGVLRRSREASKRLVPWVF